MITVWPPLLTGKLWQAAQRGQGDATMLTSNSRPQRTVHVGARNERRVRVDDLLAVVGPSEFRGDLAQAVRDLVGNASSALGGVADL